MLLTADQVKHGVSFLFLGHGERVIPGQSNHHFHHADSTWSHTEGAGKIIFFLGGKGILVPMA